MSEKLLEGKSIVFIGGGNMAEALVKGLLAAAVCPAGAITVADPVVARCKHLADAYGVRTEAGNTEAAAAADVLVLAVKPQVMSKALVQIRPVVPASALVVSIAAGVRSARIENALHAGQRVVRVMPNTPSLVGMGAAGIAAGQHATDEDLALTEALMKAVGVVVRVEESALDAVTAVSGSGPAYVFLLMESMLEAATALGLERETAKQLVYQTVEGSARLIRETGVEAEELRRRVTSKGGTTEAAMRALTDRGVREALIAAIRQAAARSRDLSAM